MARGAGASLTVKVLCRLGAVGFTRKALAQIGKPNACPPPGSTRGALAGSLGPADRPGSLRGRRTAVPGAPRPKAEVPFNGAAPFGHAHAHRPEGPCAAGSCFASPLAPRPLRGDVTAAQRGAPAPGLWGRGAASTPLTLSHALLLGATAAPGPVRAQKSRNTGCHGWLPGGREGGIWFPENSSPSCSSVTQLLLHVSRRISRDTVH